MVSINLKKLVLRTDYSLIQDVINATGSHISVETADGERLLGNEVDGNSQRYGITVDGTILGWVIGDKAAETIASLISRLAYREFEKRKLAHELLSKYKEISLLFNLSEKIIDSPNVEKVAALVLEEACQLMKSSRGALLLKEGSFLERIACFGEGNLFQETIPLDESIIGHSVQTGQGRIINNDCLSDQLSQQTALICVPLKSKESTIGAIALSRDAATPYIAEDLKLLTSVAFQAAGVINALLHERQLKESRQNDLIFQLSSQIRESLELNIILTTAVREIYSALNVDRCCFFWVRTDSSSDSKLQNAGFNGLEIVTESRRSSLSPLVGDHATEAAYNIVRWLSELTLIRVNDVSAIQERPTQEFLQAHEFASLLAVPIQTRSGQIGAICCSTSRESRDWSDSEVVLLQAVTNQLVLALDQAELYEQTCKTAQIAQEKAQQLVTTLDTLQQTQLQLIQSEKMSGIGQMMAGVAHEINNPVTFIYGNLEFVRQYVEDLMDLVKLYQKECLTPSTTLQEAFDNVDLPFLLEDLPNTLNSMAVGTERIRDIVVSLKNFARSDQAEYKSVDIHEGIDSTLLILRHRLKPNHNFPGIDIIKNYGDVPPITCYPSQLNQVFMNLLANAIDVLEVPPFASTPKITIHTHQIDPEYVQIRIVDNGPGIAASIRAKLFDPFFTTKDVGKGTGLGLSISYQIITERHHGSLECRTEIGQGTAFVINLPIKQGHLQKNAPNGKTNGSVVVPHGIS
ncbi:MAG: GAF domain-containing protein [Leptolyngbya sp. SIO3F4]|nr:GAF domain-containing protein [Leptolyngbya sp. SIO3F4]